MGSVLRAICRADRLTVGQKPSVRIGDVLELTDFPASTTINERRHLTQGTPPTVISVRFVGVGASLPAAVAGTAVRLGASLVVVASDVEASLSTYSEVRKSVPTVSSTVSGATASDAMALRPSSSASSSALDCAPVP
jgi:hypothetical protein